MKLTELILELHTIMLEKGNLDVHVHNGCGCCEWTEAPSVRLRTADDEELFGDPPGVYLN